VVPRRACPRRRRTRRPRPAADPPLASTTHGQALWRDARPRRSCWTSVLAKGRFRCTALVSSIDAGRLGLRDGGRARIARGVQTIDVEVEASDDMMPGVVSLPHGWGHDHPGTRMGLAAERPGANLNALLDETLRDPLSGNAVLAGVPVTMQPL
jgi:anaerobic selenocysteine-containing dehydrogenase